jgi:glutamate formiminotransferase/glutamate formiminotransferase/formiminotetrahydrofolate cyclodeaminase
VPNVSEGRDTATIDALSKALERVPPAPFDRDATPAAAQDVRLLDVHSDPDHDRSVFTFSAPPGALADAMLRLAHSAVSSIDVMGSKARGQHPHVGALDVAPIVYLDAAGRGAACAEALVVADRIGCELEVPVLLYGELAGGRTRAELRRGGVQALAQRMASAEHPDPTSGGPSRLSPDFGPPRLHPSAGATLVAAREPLVAFNVKLAPAVDIEGARTIAAAIREGGAQGLTGVRAIGVALGDGCAQVSMNVERPLETPLAAVLAAVASHAPVQSAELVGLAPAAALDGFPPEVALEGFDPERHIIENALRS